MPGCLSVSLYLRDACACFDREAAPWHKSYHLQFPQFVYDLQSKNKQKRIWSHKRKKRNKLAHDSKNSTVYHEASTFGTEALSSCPKIITAYQVVIKSETQVLQDRLK